MTPFHFYTKLDLVLLLGRKAANVSALLEGIRTVPAASIFYHTHRLLEQHTSVSPEPPNDFAFWAREVLNDRKLAEAISSVDIIELPSVEELRTRFIDVIHSFTRRTRRYAEAPEGQEFHFMMSQTFALPSPYVATTIAEFRTALKDISISAVEFTPPP